MALSKERKQDLVVQYEAWLKESNGLFFAEYTGLKMPKMDDLRAKSREQGAEFHVIKNRLGQLVFEAAGIEIPDELFTGSTAVGVAFEETVNVAKVLKDFGKDNPALKIKAGFMDGKLLTADQVIALADLPPLPVVRGQLLGTIAAPASKLVRTIAEPGRSLAQVIKAHADAAAA